MNKINEFEEKWYGRYSEQYTDRRCRQQFLIFCSLCSEQDRELLEERRSLDIENFRRIGYLMTAMGFDELFLAFENQHPELLLKLAGDSSFESADCQEMIQEIENWTEDFCRNVPEKGMQKYIRELLSE